METTKSPRSDIRREFNNIVLVGLSGCGKTTAGKYIAQTLGFGFVDMDDWIEQTTNKKIAAIFQQEGESFFREQEKDAFLSIGNIVNHVIAVGSGSVEDDDNWAAMGKLGVIVWLDCDIRVIANRLLLNSEGLKSRPYLADILESEPESRQAKLESRLETLMQRRIKRYSEAHVILRNAFLSEEDTARSLKFLLNSRQGNIMTKEPQSTFELN